MSEVNVVERVREVMANFDMDINPETRAICVAIAEVLQENVPTAEVQAWLATTADINAEALVYILSDIALSASGRVDVMLDQVRGIEPL